MSFEAVPCKFTCRVNDGNAAPIFGLLIRPSSQPSHVGPNGTVVTSSIEPTTGCTNTLVSAMSMSMPSNKNSSQKDLPPIRPKRDIKGCLSSINSTPTTSFSPLIQMAMTADIEMDPSFNDKPISPSFPNCKLKHFELAHGSSTHPHILPKQTSLGSLDINNISLCSQSPSSSREVVECSNALQYSTNLSLSKIPLPIPNTTTTLDSPLASTSYSQHSGLLTVSASSTTTTTSFDVELPECNKRHKKLVRKRTMKQKSFDMPSNVDFDGPTNVSHLTELNPLNYSHLFDASATSSLIGLPSSTSFGNFNTFTDPLNSMRTCVDHRNLERLPIFLPSPNSILPRISANSNASYQIYQQNAVTNNAWHPAAYQQKASSCTPDSGIQSIDGSPPSVSSYTPPLVSPYTSQMASCESVSTLPIPQSSVIQQLPIPTSSAVLEVPIDHMLPNMSSEDERRIQHIDTASNNNDLSDMPRLKPFIVEYAEQHDSLGTANTPLFPCPLTDSSIRDKQPLTRESDSMAQTEVVDSIIKTNVRVESPATSTYDLHLANESRNCPDILQLEHYRKKVQQQLNQQLLDIFESVLKKFDGLHIGSRLEHTNKSGFHSQITLRISKKHRNFPYKQITCEKKPNCMSTLEKRLGSTKSEKSASEYSSPTEKIPKNNGSSAKATSSITLTEPLNLEGNKLFLSRNLRTKKRTQVATVNVTSKKNEKFIVEFRLLLTKLMKFFLHKVNPRKWMLSHFKRSINLLTSVLCDVSMTNLIEAIDSVVLDCFALYKVSLSPNSFDDIRQYYFDLKKAMNLQRKFPSLPRNTIQNFLQTKREISKSVNTEFDLTYINSPTPVGSYDPDKAGSFIVSNNAASNDCVRCICGTSEDGGQMILCDSCRFWLHTECLDNIDPEKKEFHCDFCVRNIKYASNVDVVLRPQPEITLQNCVYYRALVNCRGIQVRLNEAIYVERLINDRHKSILKAMHNDCVKQRSQARSHSTNCSSTEPCNSDVTQYENNWLSDSIPESASTHHRSDLRIFRVERLFISPSGDRFVFGCYYARPHETFRDPSRLFYKNELFWTPLFDTLPLDAVVGRCLVLDPSIWSTGRPKFPRYIEEDVFICEYQIGKNQRSFEKNKNHYDVNIEPYIFERFEEPLALKRDFKPFISSKTSQRQRIHSKESMSVNIRGKNLENICSNIQKKFPEKTIQTASRRRKYPVEDGTLIRKKPKTTRSPRSISRSLPDPPINSLSK